MNLLFLTIGRINDISCRGIYEDLMRKFRDDGHIVFVVTPAERRYKEKTRLLTDNNVFILSVRTLNIQKTNIIEKGLSTLLIDYQYLNAIKKYLNGVIFDLVLYSTPPITFSKVVSYLKQKNKAITYLLLKDIFPQNAVDLGLIRKGSMIFRYYRAKEKELYGLSDYIGCMSPANMEFIKNQNPEINPDKIEINPNSIDPQNSLMDSRGKAKIREKYKIPINATVFIYGGNLGKPQGIDFFLETLNSLKKETGIFFLIVGSGTEFIKVENWFKKFQPSNSLLLRNLPKKEFDLLLQTCDVGLIFLDKRFTIPNFPSRLLSYMEFKLPVIASTDKNTDLGTVLLESGSGLWSEAGDIDTIKNNIISLSQNPELCHKMGENGYKYLLNNFTVSHSYKTIVKHLSGN